MVNKILFVSVIQSFVMLAVITILKKTFIINNIIFLMVVVIIGFFTYSVLNLKEVYNFFKFRMTMTDT